MGRLSFCSKFGKFSDLKELIKKKILDTFRNSSIELNNKIDYLGLSIYKKHEDELYEVNYSLSVYRNLNESIIIQENDFSGFVFKSITDIRTLGKKNHSYMKIFFKDFHLRDDEQYFLSRYKDYKYENEDIIIQIYVIFNNGTTNPELNFINDKIDSFFSDRLVECVPCSDVRLQLKKGMIILKNEIILIIDLMRSFERHNEKFFNMDSILTKQIIFEIKWIAGESNFKTINHTGDGFVFIYRGERENLEFDIESFFKKLEKTMREFKEYASTLVNLANSYKLRANIEKVDKIFEMDYLNSIDRKLYFSSFLDQAFEKMELIKIKEREFSNDISYVIRVDNNKLKLSANFYNKFKYDNSCENDREIYYISQIKKKEDVL